MSEYINREDLLKELDKEVEDADDWKTAHEIENVVKYFPTADVVENVRLSPITTATEGKPIEYVEVVRCKECMYWKPYTSQYGSGQFCECPCSFGGQGIKKPDDYCSYGERRDDKEYNNSILNARKGEE